jgi:hypothetical protein
MGEFVADNCAGMGDEGSDYILFQPQGKVEI